jgi:hypothetical protein
MADDDPAELSASEQAFKALSPWIGVIAFIVSLYYLLERGQEIPWFVFFICGGLMGLGKLILALKDLKP